MFLERILSLCKAQKISKNKLLTDLDLNKSAFVNWENRGNIPSGDVVAKIADYFHVSTDYLLGRTDDPSSAQNEKTELCFRYDGWSDDEIECYNSLKSDKKRRLFILNNGYDKNHEPDARRLLPDQFSAGKSPAPILVGDQKLNIIRIAGRDGSLVERELTDEQLAALKLIVDQLPDANDL